MLLVIPAALAATCAFMMPVVTPPNAIVFGSGHVMIAQMVRAGVWLNLVGVVPTVAAIYALGGLVFGIHALGRQTRWRVVSHAMPPAAGVYRGGSVHVRGNGAGVPDTVELVGYVASALIVLSLMMSSVLKLRIVNLVGAIIFSVYGILIGSLPVLLTNGAITLINIHHLTKLWRQQSRDAYFEVVEAEPDSNLLRRFVEFHADDIAQFQPEFGGIRDDHLAWMVLRDAAPVGVVLATRTGDGEAHIDMDYVIDAHRDFSPGSVLFGEARVFEAEGLRRVTSAPGSGAHRRYLERMGFRPEGEVLVREVP